MTYDGHGRLKTRKTPVESAATVYDYNADDTVFKRTDARGASSNYTYNARHLMTGISYTKPATASADDTGPTAIPNPGAVAFGYDQVGNRLWMTDGQGRTDYQYDTWSRLISETRYFTELNKSFSISYTYNLAGELTRLTDPFGSVINYGYDSAGQLTGTSGSGYGSVTQFVSAIGYRAWGGLKRMTYGDTSMVELSYDARLRLSRYTLNTAGNDYQYYTDSRVKSAKQINGNAEFDRSYKYDHAGRMTEALTGRASRGEPADPNEPDPYKQTYQYDAMGNLTGRVNTLWNHEVASFQASYVNDRNVSWTYDEEGNVKNDLQGQFTYDTASRMTKWESAADTISQKYDGEGQAAKRIETRSTPAFTSTIYYVRSSVMGGQVIAEVDAGGKRQVSYVYANGIEIAKYKRKTATSPYQVYWVHSDPVTADRVEGVQGGSDGSSHITDPLGGLVPGSDPFATNPNPTYSELLGEVTSYTDDADPFAPGSGCTLDGVPMSCSLLTSLVAHGGVAAAPLKSVTLVRYQGRDVLAFWQAYADGYQGFVPVTAAYTGGGGFRPAGERRSELVRGGGAAAKARSRMRDADFVYFRRLNGASDSDPEALLARSVGLQQQNQTDTGANAWKLKVDFDWEKSERSKQGELRECGKFNLKITISNVKKGTADFGISDVKPLHYNENGIRYVGEQKTEWKGDKAIVTGTFQVGNILGGGQTASIGIQFTLTATPPGASEAIRLGVDTAKGTQEGHMDAKYLELRDTINGTHAEPFKPCP